MFIQSTYSEKIAVSIVISSLHINKASGPCCNKIVILLKKDISKQLAYLFNFPVPSGSFSSILKAVKVVPVFKKGI